jgi:FixJ family two-component response regulator
MMEKEKKKYPEFPVLVVDDDKNFLNSLDFDLRSRGINNVECCDKSFDVMPRLKSKKYSVILLDLMMEMEGIPGEELLVDIVKEYPEIPVIILTGVEKAEIAVNCMKKGPYDYLFKPVDTEKLIGIIQDAVDTYHFKLSTPSGRKLMYLKKEIQKKLTEIKDSENKLVDENDFMIRQQYETDLLKCKTLANHYKDEYDQLEKNAELKDIELIRSTDDLLGKLFHFIDKIAQILQQKKLLVHYQIDKTANIVSDVLRMANIETLKDIEAIIVHSDEIEEIFIHKVVTDTQYLFSLINDGIINCKYHAFKKKIQKVAKEIPSVKDMKIKFNLYLPFIPLILINKGELENESHTNINLDIELKALGQKWNHLLEKINQKKR